MIPEELIAEFRAVSYRDHRMEQTKDGYPSCCSCFKYTTEIEEHVTMKKSSLDLGYGPLLMFPEKTKINVQRLVEDENLPCDCGARHHNGKIERIIEELRKH